MYWYSIIKHTILGYEYKSDHILIRLQIVQTIYIGEDTHILHNVALNTHGFCTVPFN